MPGIVKGSLISYDDETVRVDFMFNPTEIQDKKGATWGKTQVPHVSHPVYQFGGGTERIISFQLHLDGDRGQMALNRNTLDVSQEVRTVRSFLYPASLESVEGAGSSSPYWVARPPSRVIFTYGTFWRGLLCVLTRVDVTGTFFSATGELIQIGRASCRERV